MRRQNHLLGCSGCPFLSCLRAPAKSHPSRVNSYLALLGGDGGIPVDELCEDPSQGLNAQGEGSHIQQQHICHIPSQHPTLDSCSHGHSLVRIDCFAGSTAKQLLHSLLHLRGDTAQHSSAMGEHHTQPQQPWLSSLSCCCCHGTLRHKH